MKLLIDGDISTTVGTLSLTGAGIVATSNSNIVAQTALTLDLSSGEMVFLSSSSLQSQTSSITLPATTCGSGIMVETPNTWSADTSINLLCPLAVNGSG